MPQQKVFFSFADGLFQYSCNNCHQPCCHTQCIHVSQNEANLLIQKYPETEALQVDFNENIKLLELPPSGCWFLDKQSCRLKSGALNHLRPDICHLFPFNLYGRLGDILVVGANGLCPLSVSPDEGVHYSDLSQQLRQYQVIGDIPDIRAEYGASILPLEEEIVLASELLVEEDSIFLMIGFMDVATMAWQQGGDSLSHIDFTKIEKVAHSYIALLDVYSNIIGYECPPESCFASTTKTITAWVPTIRLFGFDEFPLHCLPRAFLVLSLLVAYWQSLRQERSVSPQTVQQIISSLKSIIYLLSIWHSPWDGKHIEKYKLDKGMKLDRVLGDQLNKIEDKQRIRWLHQVAKDLQILL